MVRLPEHKVVVRLPEHKVVVRLSSVKKLGICLNVLRIISNAFEVSPIKSSSLRGKIIGYFYNNM